MHTRWLVSLTALSLLGAAGFHQGQRHLNPVVDLLAARKPVFGVYGPRNPRARPGAPAATDTAKPKTPAELAKDALGYATADYIFDGSMEGDFDRNYPVFAEFAKGMAEGGIHGSARGHAEGVDVQRNGSARVSGRSEPGGPSRRAWGGTIQ